MKVLPYLVGSILGAIVLQLPSAACQSSSGAILKRALVTSAQCDDAQDAIMTNPIFHAAVFANATIDKRLPDGTDFRKSTAFSNYFQDTDFPTVSKLFQHINAYAYSRELRYPSLFFLCPQPDAIPEACKSDNPFVFADPDSRAYSSQPELLSSGFGFCPRFFSPSEPKMTRMVWSKGDDEWCADDQKGLSFYWTVGYMTVRLFAMTDAYGVLAGIPSRPVAHKPGIYPREQTHGAGLLPLSGLNTLTPQTPWNAARNLKQAWAKGPGVPKPELLRVQSADSYAAAATEWYFMTLCGREKTYRFPDEKAAEGGPWG